VVPCLNEAGSIDRCVREAKAALDDAGWEGAVIVADNGSDDGSAELARAAGALVVHDPVAATAARTWPASPRRKASTS
jgi:glycosyltransferase involved in cell wall biosynthesis